MLTCDTVGQPPPESPEELAVEVVAGAGEDEEVVGAEVADVDPLAAWLALEPQAARSIEAETTAIGTMARHRRSDPLATSPVFSVISFIARLPLGDGDNRLLSRPLSGCALTGHQQVAY